MKFGRLEGVDNPILRGQQRSPWGYSPLNLTGMILQVTVIFPTEPNFVRFTTSHWSSLGVKPRYSVVRCDVQKKFGVTSEVYHPQLPCRSFFQLALQNQWLVQMKLLSGPFRPSFSGDKLAVKLLQEGSLEPSVRLETRISKTSVTRLLQCRPFPKTNKNAPENKPKLAPKEKNQSSNQ